VNPPTGFRPRNSGGGTCLDAIEASANFCRPFRFCVGIDFVLEALKQFARERGALFV